MTFYRVRDGKYLYQETRVREGNKVRSISRYIGKVSGGTDEGSSGTGGGTGNSGGGSGGSFSGEVQAFDAMNDAHLNPPTAAPQARGFDQAGYLAETHSPAAEAPSEAPAGAEGGEK